MLMRKLRLGECKHSKHSKHSKHLVLEKDSTPAKIDNCYYLPLGWADNRQSTSAWNFGKIWLLYTSCLA